MGPLPTRGLSPAEFGYCRKVGGHLRRRNLQLLQHLAEGANAAPLEGLGKVRAECLGNEAWWLLAGTTKQFGVAVGGQCQTGSDPEQEQASIASCEIHVLFTFLVPRVFSRNGQARTVNTSVSASHVHSIVSYAAHSHGKARKL